MACFAAYTGLRWGELAALTIGQINPAARTVTVDRKVIEIGGTLYVEAPQGPRNSGAPSTPPAPPGDMGPLADMIAARIEAAQAAQHAGTSPLGLVFASPRGRHWRSSNLRPARPGTGLPRGGMARRRRQRHLGLAQPAARVLHHRPVHLEDGRRRRLPPGRARQHPHHPRHVRRRHRRHPRPRPHRHRITPAVARWRRPKG